MNDISRRDVLKAGVAVTAAAAGAGLAPGEALAQAAEWKSEPEKGARLRVLRWSQFVQGDWDKWVELTQEFTKKTGIEVRVDKESWEDVRPKAAVAANVGAGPDIIIGTNDDPRSSSTSPISRPTSATSTADGTTPASSTACATRSGSRCPRARRAPASTTASAPSRRPDSRRCRRTCRTS
jgi:hypothetical protein